jgi:hypothetical protein
MTDENIETPGDESPTTSTGDAQESTVPGDRRPLGFWLRTVDALITREFAVAFHNEGVTRRDWMLLNALAGDVDAPGLAERLARRPKRLRGLEKRGWAQEGGDGTWVLTEQGRVAKENLSAVVDGIRTRVAGSVSTEDFATTVASLEAIARELGWDETKPTHGWGFGRGRVFGPGSGFGAFGPESGFGPGFGGFGPGFGGFGPGHHGFHAPGFRADVDPDDPQDRSRPDFRRGYGPGFRPGFGPGFPDPRRAWAGRWNDECRGEHMSDARHGHGLDDHRHGGHGHGGHGHRHGDRPFGGDRRGASGHGAEDAYERGFDAGYTRGAAERG